MNLKNEDKLVVLWSSGDRDVAMNMVFMYTFNSKTKKWWDNITLIVWGPSSKLLSVDLELQQFIKKIIDAGVKVEACKACADNYGVSNELEKLGIEVKYMGQPLTHYLKNGFKILTF